MDTTFFSTDSMVTYGYLFVLKQNGSSYVGVIFIMFCEL